MAHVSEERRRSCWIDFARMLAAASVLVPIIGCGETGPAPSPPVVPSPTPSVPVPAPPAGEFTLSGGIYEVAADGSRRPFGANQVSIEVEVPTPRDPKRGGWVPVGADGRYRLTGVPDGRFVKVTQVATLGPNGRRLCATNTIMAGDTELDVHVYRPGATLPGSIVSGQVWASIGGRKVPLVGADVYFRSRAYGPDVFDYTDAAGRYSLCGIQPAPSELYMYCGNDLLIYRTSLFVQSDVVIDIDATSF